MADEPRFPSPDEAKRQTGTSDASGAPTESISAAPKRVVVTRAEPLMRDADGGSEHEKPKLTREEMRALLAVDGANRSTALGTAFKRGRRILIPTTILGAVVHYGLGVAEPWASIAVILAAVAWTARPLLRRDDWS